MGNSDPMVRGEGLRKAYKGRVALDGVTVEWRLGCVVGVVGPNGAGKSTLLDVLSGRITADSGRTWIGGAETTGWPLERVARLGVVRSFQAGNAVRGLTVLENVIMAAEPRRLASLSAAMVGRRDGEAEAAARSALEVCGLSHLADSPAHQISFGQRKVLSMAMCVATRARVMLLDEPFAGVDGELVSTIEAEVNRQRARGSLVVLVEHDLDRIGRISDEVVLMRAGLKASPMVKAGDARGDGWCDC